MQSQKPQWEKIYYAEEFCPDLDLVYQNCQHKGNPYLEDQGAAHKDQGVLKGNPHIFVMKHFYVIGIPGGQIPFGGRRQTADFLKAVENIYKKRMVQKHCHHQKGPAPKRPAAISYFDIYSLPYFTCRFCAALRTDSLRRDTANSFLPHLPCFYALGIRLCHLFSCLLCVCSKTFCHSVLSGNLSCHDLRHSVKGGYTAFPLKIS